MLKQLTKTLNTWTKVQKSIGKLHQRAQILKYCLRTRFHHFCRAIRPSKMVAPILGVLQGLQNWDDNENKYRKLPETTDRNQSAIDYIDNWFMKQYLGVTGQWQAEDVNLPNQFRTTFPRRRGGMGFTTLKDVIPGAFAAAMLECLYPRGLNESAEPQNGDISLRLSCPVIDRMMPHWSKEERRLNIPPTATPTERLYLLSVPIRLSEDGVSSLNPRGPAEPLTPDFQEIQRSLRDLALHPRLRCLLYENKILRHMGGIDNEIRRNDTQMIFSKTSLMYEQLPQRLAEDRGIDENQIKRQFQDSQAKI